ncbi:hypothetical protein, partial [Gordonibacter sp.]|uniref:hypothetical protein n=1 Tax=Gordonibacter sp. TaxID=1968902 RepID=UPI002FCA6DDA
MARGSGEGRAKRGGLFDDLSMAQVAAGALAAVTSMLLASRIGIAGSVIGVAVGSIVSAVASQLYKKFFLASADKLRELKPGEAGYGDSDKEEDVGVEKADAGRTVRIEAPAVHRSKTPCVDDIASRGDATAQRVQRMRERRKKVQRRVVVVSAASALVAVAVSALMIEFVTTGQGVGVKTTPIVSSSILGQGSGFGDASAPGASSSESGSKGEQGASGSGDSPKDPSSSDNGGGSSSGSTGNQGSGGSGSSDGSQGGGTGGGSA